MSAQLWERPFVRACLASLAVALALGAAIPFLADRHQATTGDGADYVRMARDPGVFPEAPEGYRILTPWLAGAVPGGVDAGFDVVTVFGLALAAGLLYLFVRRAAGDESAAITAVLLFVASGACAGAVRNPYLVDPLAFAFVAGGFFLIFERRWLASAATIACGILAKDTVLFLILPALLVGLCCRPHARWRQLLAVAAVPLAVYALLHGTPIVFANRGHHSYIADIRGVFRYERTEIGLARAPVQAFLYSFGALWVAAALSLRRVDCRWRASASYVLPVVASMIIAADWPRVLGFAFPVVIGLVCALPLTQARRAVLVASVFADSWGFEALPSSALKQAALLAALLAGILAVLQFNSTGRARFALPDSR